MGTQEKQQLKQEILNMPALPTLPSNIIILMEMLRDTRTPASEAIQRIEQDQVLSARVLKLVNSSYYSTAYGVASIAHAVALLGYEEIWKLVVGSAAMELISANDLNLWLHSYTSSILMKELIEAEGINCSSKIQLTMLMHDIGKIVLLNYNLEAYRKVQDSSIEDSTMAHTVEEAQLGVNHAEVGSWLLESWALDEEQVLPIAQHHCTALPDLYATESILIKLVDYLDHAARGHHYPPPEVEELESIGLGDLDQERWLQQHQTRISELNLSDQPQARASD